MLSKGELVLVFAGKVAMGCLYGYIFSRFYGGDDTWQLHQLGIFEHHKLVNNTAQFFIDLDPLDPIRRNASLSRGLHFLLLDYEYWMISKPLAVFNFLSGSNYYVNIVFFSFITFWGPYWLFSLLLRIFPAKRKLIFFFVFLFPPVLFWLSGLRADGMLMLFFSLMLLQFYQWVHERKKRAIIFFLTGFAGVLIFRDVMVLLLVPGLLGWFLVKRYSTRPMLTFALLWIICIVVFWASALLPASFSMPVMVATRQHEYLALKANTRFELDSLRPAFNSYMHVLPQAVRNVYIRPYLWEAKGFLQLATAVSIMIMWLLVLLVIIRKEMPWSSYFRNPVILFFLFFCLNFYLLIGYTVPFPGAIVRYKVIPELLLFLVIVLNVRGWKNAVAKGKPPAIHEKK
jgi:hypothetical protein